MIVWGDSTPRLILTTAVATIRWANSWTALQTNGAPPARYLHTAVWTGREMIIFGGYDTVSLNDTWSYLPGPPFLSIQGAGGDTLVSWVVSSPGYHLQQSTNLSTTKWTDAAAPQNINGTNQVTISPSTGNRFFRLISP